MTRYLLLILLPMLVLTGCETTSRSLNYECSALRAGGDLTATAALDNDAVTGEDLDLIADGLDQLASDQALTFGAAVARIEAIPPAYRQYVSELLDWCSRQAKSQYSTALSSDARRRIRAYSCGLRTGAREYVPLSAISR